MRKVYALVALAAILLVACSAKEPLVEAIEQEREYLSGAMGVPLENITYTIEQTTDNSTVIVWFDAGTGILTGIYFVNTAYGWQRA
jgi:hypothetical protein